MPLKRLKKYASFYKIAHHQRVQLFNLKWRLFVILVVAVAMFGVYEYLQWRYPITFFDELRQTPVILSDRVFEWFGIGVAFGVIALAALYEGEFMLSVRKLTKHFEQQAAQLLGMHQKKQRNPKQSAKKKSKKR